MIIDPVDAFSEGLRLLELLAAYGQKENQATYYRAAPPTISAKPTGFILSPSTQARLADFHPAYRHQVQCRSDESAWVLYCRQRSPGPTSHRQMARGP